MADPLVSVIIPTYNRADTIQDAVNSVLQQTYEKIEIIVVDDGSTDDTPNRLAIYGDTIHVLLRQDNRGPSIARNRGVEISHGEILAFLDSDDLWLPMKVSRQVALLQRADSSVPCCLCNATMKNLTPNGQTKTSFDYAAIKPSYREGVWKNVMEVLSTRFVFFTQAVAIRREAFLKVGGFDESLRIMEDHDLALRLSLLGQWVYIRDPLVIYQGNLTGLAHMAMTKKALLYEAIVQIYPKILTDNRITSHKLRRRMEHNFRLAQRELLLVLEHDRQEISSLILRSLVILERFKMKLFRNCPWYPKIDDSPVDAS